MERSKGGHEQGRAKQKGGGGQQSRQNARGGERDKGASPGSHGSAPGERSDNKR